MKNIVERQLIKITDDLIVKRGYVERVVAEDGGVDWLMNGKPISDEHIKEMLEKRLNSVKVKKTIQKLKYIDKGADNILGLTMRRGKIIEYVKK